MQVPLYADEPHKEPYKTDKFVYLDTLTGVSGAMGGFSRPVPRLNKPGAANGFWQHMSDQAAPCGAYDPECKVSSYSRCRFEKNEQIC